jgi:hypothetical protein
MSYVDGICLLAVLGIPWLCIRWFFGRVVYYKLSFLYCGLSFLISLVLWGLLCFVGASINELSSTERTVEVISIRADDQFFDVVRLVTRDGKNLETARIERENLTFSVAELPTEKLLAVVSEVVAGPCSWWPKIFPFPPEKTVLWTQTKASVTGSEEAIQELLTKF